MPSSSDSDHNFTGCIQEQSKMMHMTFYWGTRVTLLIDSWKTDSLLSYLLTLLACFLFSAFYQYLEDRRIRFKSASSSAAQPPSADAPLLQLPKLGSSSTTKYVGALLFGVNSAIGYLLMLAVMSFNGGVFVSVVLGLATGYLLFRCGGDEEVVVAVDNTCACA
ncbi:Copper transporter 5 [Linum grandiflorum]